MADKKLNEVTKVTDMAYVPVIMADGSIGQIAKSDLASVVAGVLGNPIGDKTYYIQKDLDNLTENGIYSCYYTQGDRFNEAHYPGSKSEYLQILVSKSVQWIRQTAIDVTTSETFVRAKDGAKGWSPWTRLDNFGYNTLADLSSAVAGFIPFLNDSYSLKHITGHVLYQIGSVSSWSRGAFIASMGTYNAESSCFVSITFCLAGTTPNVSYEQTKSIAAGLKILTRYIDNVLYVYLWSSVSTDSALPCMGFSSQKIKNLGNTTDISEYTVIGEL